MSNFNEKQWKELAASAIDSDIAELNISILTGNPALQAIFYALGNEERKNTGQVRDKWLRTYDPIYKNGGMAFFGVDPLTDERTECISFKPETRISPDRKYENPPKAKPIAFYPAVTYRVWSLVCDRFNIARPTGAIIANQSFRASGFWVWVIENNIQIIITEGIKKALSAISQGFPCIAVTGVWNGVRAMKDDKGDTDYYSLIPSLRILKDKKILIAFDRDEKARTIATVMKARAALASALIDNQCECYSIIWDSKFKGLDDLIASDGGLIALEQSIAKAKLLTGEAPNFKKKLVKNMMGEDLATESKGRMSFDAISKTWQIYTDGRWKAKGQDGLEALIYKRVVQDVPEINSVSLIPDIMKFMKYQLTVEEWAEASTLEFFPFKNGVWSFKDKKLLPHSPDYLWKWQLDRDYSLIDTGWESIDKFLDTVSSGDGSIKNLLIAACGSVLQGTPEIQKALYLFGSGANGKGSFLKLLEMLVGDENAHSTTLENICENRFEMANLCDKRLVICPDEDRRVRGLSAFKSLTGGDSLRAEEKGKKAYKFTFKGMVAIASNTPTFYGDDSYGLSRRLIPIPFRYQVPESQRRNLLPEFTDDLPAFTTYLLNLDRDWITNTLKQANNLPAIKDLAWELTIQTDSVAAFYEEKMIYEPGSQVLAADVYPQYKQFCNDAGFLTKHQNNFCPSLVNLLVDKLGKDVKSRKTKTGKVIEGVRLRSVLDPIGDEVTTVTTILEKIENKSSSDLGDEVTTVTTVTTKTEKQFSLESSPKPPTSDRPIPKITKVNDYVEYQLMGDSIQWLEIAFHKHSIAKDWQSQLDLWGCKTSNPTQISRNGKKWLLSVKGLTWARLESILSAELGQSPRKPSHR